MSPAIHINPDHYLETEAGRIYTPERSAVAWESAYAELENALRSAPPTSNLYLVIGVQGGGKSTWIGRNAPTVGKDAVFFDAALPKARHRERAVSIARSCKIPVVCVWLQVPLDVALRRNAGRRTDHQVPEDAIRSVFSMFEPPSEQEGFSSIRIVGFEEGAG